MKDHLFTPARRIEEQYKKALVSIFKKIQGQINHIGEPKEIVKILRKVINSKEFNSFADATAMKMVTQLFKDGGRSWKEAARKNSKGLNIYFALKKELEGKVGKELAHQVKRNAEIIKSMPLDASKKLTEYIANETIKGKRSSQIAEEIKIMFPKMSVSKAKLIARTEASKTNTALTRARSESADCNWYFWRTSSDSRVRSSHEHMEDVLIKWSDPPSPEALIGEKNLGHYHAGNIFNCRCVPAVLVNIDFETWPKKVYHNGRIQTMTKNKFKEVM